MGICSGSGMDPDPDTLSRKVIRGYTEYTARGEQKMGETHIYVPGIRGSGF